MVVIPSADRPSLCRPMNGRNILPYASAFNVTPRSSLSVICDYEKADILTIILPVCSLNLET
jgi:hypothetical protein